MFSMSSMFPRHVYLGCQLILVDFAAFEKSFITYSICSCINVIVDHVIDISQDEICSFIACLKIAANLFKITIFILVNVL